MASPRSRKRKDKKRAKKEEKLKGHPDGAKGTKAKKGRKKRDHKERDKGKLSDDGTKHERQPMVASPPGTDTSGMVATTAQEEERAPVSTYGPTTSTETDTDAVTSTVSMDYRDKSGLQYARDVVFLLLTGSIFERNSQRAHLIDETVKEGMPRRKQRVSFFFLNCGSVLYGFSITFYLFAFLCGSVYYGDCEVELVYLLLVLGGVNCVGSAVFCVFTYSRRLSSLVLALIMLCDVAGVVFGVYSLAFPEGWEYQLTDREVIEGQRYHRVCNLETYVMVIAMLVVAGLWALLALFYVMLTILWCMKEDEKAFLVDLGKGRAERKKRNSSLP